MHVQPENLSLAEGRGLTGRWPRPRWVKVNPRPCTSLLVLSREEACDTLWHMFKYHCRDAVMFGF